MSFWSFEELFEDNVRLFIIPSSKSCFLTDFTKHEKHCKFFSSTRPEGTNLEQTDTREQRLLMTAVWSTIQLLLTLSWWWKLLTKSEILLVNTYTHTHTKYRWWWDEKGTTADYIKSNEKKKGGRQRGREKEGERGGGRGGAAQASTAFLFAIYSFSILMYYRWDCNKWLLLVLERYHQLVSFKSSYRALVYDPEWHCFPC